MIWAAIDELEPQNVIRPVKRSAESHGVADRGTGHPPGTDVSVWYQYFRVTVEGASPRVTDHIESRVRPGVEPFWAPTTPDIVLSENPSM